MNTLIEFDIMDEVGPFLSQAANFSKSLKSAGKSLGWFMQRKIKKGVRSGSPGGETFTERRPFEMRKALGGGSAASKWYGQMTQAIGYQYKDGRILIGWTSRTSAMYGRKQEFGYQTAVTDEIRKKFAIAGYPLRKSTKVILLPDRPFYEPMAGALEPEMGTYLHTKLLEYANGDVAFAKKARRRYKVY